MTAVSVAATPSSPLDPRQRLEIMDMVRGFALFGVLLVNMMNFGAFAPIWTGPLDELVSWGQRFFFEMKSWSLFSFLFGYGFGQYFAVGPAGVFGYTVLFFAVQIVASVWWLRHFQFGPAEWLWRTLTYLKPPIRIESSA